MNQNLTKYRHTQSLSVCWRAWRLYRLGVARALLLTLATAALSLNAVGSPLAAKLPAWHGHGRTVQGPQGAVYFAVEGQGPPVVLVAGGPGGSHASFHPWFSKLATRYTVVYLDNVGRGRAGALPANTQPSVARDASDIEVVRKALGVARVSVIGHSYGGMVAAAYLAQHNDTARCTVFSNAVPSATAWQAGLQTQQAMAAEQTPEAWQQILALRALGTKSSDAKYMALWDESELDTYWYSPAHATRAPAVTDKRDQPRADVYAAFLGDDPEWAVGGALAGFDVSAALAKQRLPVLVVSGRYDRAVSPRVALALHQVFGPGVSTLKTFTKSGHRPWLEEHAAYFAAVTRFLDACHAEPAVGATPKP
jgi:proline iminopeptidase